MQFTISEAFQFVTVVVLVTGFFSTIAYNILANKFVTPEQLKKHEDDCQDEMCRKIDDIKKQGIDITNSLQKAREASEQKRDAARIENTAQMKAIYELIQSTEKDRSASLKEIHTFMGQVSAKIEAIEKRLP